MGGKQALLYLGLVCLQTIFVNAVVSFQGRAYFCREGMRDETRRTKGTLVFDLIDSSGTKLLEI